MISTLLSDFHKMVLTVLKATFQKKSHVKQYTGTIRKFNSLALKNKFYKSKSIEDEMAFMKQRNFCNRLCKKERRKYFNSRNLKNITDINIFWITVKPFSSNKGIFQKQITLIEDNNIFSADKAVAEKLSNYFQKAVK